MMLLLKNATGWNVLTNDWTMVEKSDGTAINYQCDSGDYVIVNLPIDQVMDMITRSTMICDLREYCQ